MGEMSKPQVVFVQPFSVNADLAQQLCGRVVVLDVAFCADTERSSYATTTLPFIEALGPRLVLWVDHHEHQRHIDFAADRRFVLSSRSKHPATPEMITPELADGVGRIDTVVAHGDLDGIYAAAKFLLGGLEAYPGADDDACATDSRQGEMSLTAQRIDNALKSSVESDENVRHIIIRYLLSRRRDTEAESEIVKRAAVYEAVKNLTSQWAQRYMVEGPLAIVDIREETGRIDLTQLLLAGQRLAPVAIVRNRSLYTGEPQITIAAATDSGYDFVKLLGLGGGMPTRVTLPDDQFGNAANAIKQFLADKEGKHG